MTSESMKQMRKQQSERVTKDGKPYHPRAPHGTSNGYTNYGCRCTPCRKAATVLISQNKANRMAERVLVDGKLHHPRAPHGTDGGYGNYGCRCEPCTSARRQAELRRAQRRKANQGATT